MDFIYKITVHNYCEGKFDDRVLTPHSKIYGINGKDIIGPLRKINGKQYCIKSDSDIYSVRELWKRIDSELWAGNTTFYGENLADFINKYNVVEKFLVFNGIRYYVDDINKPLLFYLQRMGKSSEAPINVQLLIDSNAGDLYVADGIRYFMPSKEQGKHNLPHIHVDIHHDYTGTFSLQNGKQLAGDKFKAKDLKKIQDTIMNNQREWTEFWNQHTDGITADLNQVLGYVQ